MQLSGPSMTFLENISSSMCWKTEWEKQQQRRLESSYGEQWEVMSDPTVNPDYNILPVPT